VLIGQTEDPARRRGLEWAAESLEARLSPRDMRPSQLSAYAGQYGERTISVEAGQLHYARDGGTPQPLIALGDHRFAFTDTSDIRVVFDMNGRIADAMEFHMADGRARRYPRGE
jgi:retinol-binding protein 3